MRAEFSEFTFGFSVVQELTTALGCTAVPVFPSLIEEGQSGGGYDVKMNLGAVPFYVQFKLSEHLKTNNAKEAKVASSPLIAPFRRFPITSSITSKQHEMLVALNAKHDHVYYCAPDYVTNAALNALWQAGASANRSVYVKPADIGPITDGEKHTVCFDHTSLAKDTCYFFSSPQKLATHPLTSLRASVQSALTGSTRPLRDLLPEWLSGFDEARDEADAFHGKRVEAIYKLQEKRRSAREADRLSDDFNVAYRRIEDGLFASEFIDDVENLPPAFRTPRARESEPDPDRDNLMTLAQRAASEFGVQTFILQRPE